MDRLLTMSEKEIKRLDGFIKHAGHVIDASRLLFDPRGLDRSSKPLAF